MDPKTVVLAKKVDATAVGVPKLAVDLQPGIYKYKETIVAGGQQIIVSLSTTIESGADGWTATDVVDAPSGQATDAATLEKGSLIVRKRNLKQGPVTISLDFSSNKASGTMSMNGQDRPISAQLTGPLFADSAGAQQSIACLPLATVQPSALSTCASRKRS